MQTCYLIDCLQIARGLSAAIVEGSGIRGVTLVVSLDVETRWIDWQRMLLECVYNPVKI